MYRKRRYGSRKYNCARRKFAGDNPASDQLPVIFSLPDLRRRIVIEDFDTGEVVRHEIELYKTNRIDCYRVCVDGKQLARRMGWSRVLELVRKGFYRI